MKKRIIAMLLTVTLVLSLTVTGFADTIEVVSEEVTTFATEEVTVSEETTEETLEEEVPESSEEETTEEETTVEETSTEPAVSDGVSFTDNVTEEGVAVTVVKIVVKAVVKIVKAVVTETLRRQSDAGQIIMGEEGKDTTYIIDEWTMKDEATGAPNWNPVFNYGIIIKGNVTLIIKDGVKCTVGQYYKNKDQGKDSPADAGITVTGDSSLTIVAGNCDASAITDEEVMALEDPKGTGHLICYGGYHSAGIGGESDVNGQKGENITIEDCYVDAYGGEGGAGIGGGYSGESRDIIINGGHVYAVGGKGGAGIGSGKYGGNEGYDNTHTWYFEDNEVGGGNRIYINGGNVEAYGDTRQPESVAEHVPMVIILLLQAVM